MTENNKTVIQKNRFEIIISCIFLVGVLVCILIISLSDLTGKESAILSLFLTLLSLIASWLIARVYSDSQHDKAIAEVKEMHNEKIRTFALKAAEKVNNLSEQINKLSIYLEESLNDSSYEEDKESLQSKEERIESAIHILGMLKSVNDTSLSDWHGVIDEKIEEQREAREEREEELRSLIHRLEAIIVKSNKDNEDTVLSKQIEIMKKDMRLLMTSVSGAHIPSLKIHKRKVRKELLKSCPKCNEELKYTQKAKNNSIKTIYCKGCNALIHSHYSFEKDDFVLEVREEKNEEVTCSECKSKITFVLDTKNHAKKIIKCGQCQTEIQVSRKQNGQVSCPNIPNIIMSSEINENKIDMIKRELPVQPWPNSIHKDIAIKLGMSNAAVSKGIRILIERGEFKEQINGELYDLVKSKI